MPEFAQKTRLLFVNTTLGDDELLLESFSGMETVSQLFQFDLSLLSENRRIDFTQIVGKPISFGVHLFEEDKQRWFHGIVSQFQQVPSISRLGRYRARVVPWLWYLSRTADCRIYQNKSVPDIVEEIFGEHDLKDFRKSLSGSHPTREYCVQYRETALNFVMRLLEEEGIFFYFEHEQTKHTMVMGDADSAWGACPEQSRFRLERHDISYRRLEDSITSWGYGREIRPGKYGLNDFNFETPSTDLTQSVPSQIHLGGNDNWEIFDYPGGFSDRSGGSAVTNLRMEEEEAACTVIHGESNARTMVSGHKFELTDHERDDQNGEYVLLSVTHSGAQTGFSSGETQESRYLNVFTAIPEGVPYRPPRITPKRLVGGPQTAIVVGRAGEEITTDKYGRVKVQFHWDRRGKGDENSSCWVRVSQPWAGKTWGAINIPRIGQEVVVDFLEGDADRPIITGRVYNAIEMPPYPLPDKQNITTIKSNSSKGGGGFNELRFDDTKGEEQIFIHAEKNFDTRVKADAFETVGNNSHTVVEKDRFVHIKNNRHTFVDQDEMVKIGKDHHLKIDGKQCVEITQTHSSKINGAAALEFGQGYTHKVAQGHFTKAGTFFQVEGGTDITLKVGGNSIVIDSTGVTIKGNLVTIDSTLCKINSGPGSPAMTGVPGNRVSPVAPTKAEDADDADPGKVDELKAKQREAGIGKYGAPQLKPFRPAPKASPQQSSAPGAGGAPPSEKEPEPHFIEVDLVDTNGNPVPGERYRIKFSDGTVAEGTLDEKGHVRIDNIPPGECEVTFPDTDEEAISE